MTKTRLLDSLVADSDFIARHNGPDIKQQDAMLAAINATSLEHVIEETVPADIRLPEPLNLSAPKSETQMLAELSDIATQNTIKRSLIGQGYYHTHTPPPILRNVLENPGWYTAYTPISRDIARPIRILTELPANGNGLNGDGFGQRVAARRSHCRGGSHDPV